MTKEIGRFALHLVSEAMKKRQNSCYHKRSGGSNTFAVHSTSSKGTGTWSVRSK